MEHTVNPFHITGYKHLFFDIFYKNNNIYIVCPIYNTPFQPNEIQLYANTTLINVTEQYIRDTVEHMTMYVYKYESSSPEIQVTVIYNTIQREFILKHYTTTESHTLALTTMFKHDYNLFPIFYKYYKTQGVTHFYMYYNGVITPEIKEIFNYDDVSLIEWNYLYWNPPHENIHSHHTQPAQIQHALYRYAKDICTYMIFCDLDEYLSIPNSTLKDTILVNPTIDTFGFRTMWATTVDNRIPTTFPSTILTGKIIDYPWNSKNIYKVKSIKILHIHWADIYTIENPQVMNDFIMFHFFNWSQPSRTANDCNTHMSNILEI